MLAVDNENYVKISTNPATLKSSFREKVNELKSCFAKEASEVMELLHRPIDDTIKHSIEASTERYEQLSNDQHVKLQVLKQVKSKSEQSKIDGKQLHEIELLKEECNKLTCVLEQRRDEFNVLKNCVEKKARQLERYLQLYNNILGLEYGKSHDDVFSFTFKYIDKNNPDDKYRIGLKIVDGLFRVMDCDSPIASIDRLVQELNQNNDLGAFVSSFRNELCLLAVN